MITCHYCEGTVCSHPDECARLIPHLQNMERDHLPCAGPEFPEDKKFPDFHENSEL